jgi:hypothetical protein
MKVTCEGFKNEHRPMPSQEKDALSSPDPSKGEKKPLKQGLKG